MKPEPAAHALPYRPEIDGLRAIAVLQVVLYHAGLPLPAGFVGVDVFFVISGYLITALLQREWQHSGRIDLVAFYARRVRRIFPAALLVVVVTLCACLLLLPPAALREAAHSAAAAAMFAANLFFQFASGGYFDTRAEDLPLLHLWSLAVEEQFYLVWPALLIVLLRRRAGSVLVLLGTLSLISLLLAEALLQQSAQAAFYLAPARFWELGAGGLVALAGLRRRPPAALVWFAFLLLLGCAFVPTAHFPGLGALPAVAATALLLQAVHAGAAGGGVAAALRWTPLAGLGRLSYSLYLWHWPLLALYNATVLGPGELSVRLALCGLALLIAAATYRYVEQPLRRRPASGRLLAAGIAAAVLVAVAALLVAARVPVLAPPDAAELQARRAEADLPPDWRRCHYHVAARDFPRADCASRNDRAATVAIWGDSMAMSWKPLAWELAAVADTAAIAYSRDACGPLPAHLPEPALPADRLCQDFNRAVLARLDGVDTLILVLRLGDEGAAARAALLGPTLALVSPRVRRVLVLGPSPELRDAVPKCLRAARPEACAIPRAAFDRAAGPVLDVLRVQAARFPNVEVVALGDFFCSATECPALHEGQPLYWDSHHVSASAAAAFARAYPSLAPPRAN